MVATLGRMAVASYYLESQRSFRPTESQGLGAGTGAGGLDAATGYYIEGDEPDGVWWNPAGLLGLADGDAVDAADFTRLYHGFDPRSEERLTRNAGSKTRSPGIDITFSADKSISALWAIAPREMRDEIAQAHNDACRQALEDVVRAHCGWTRTRPGGGDIELVRAELVGAMFQHGTSRSDDPQLHTHCLIFNATRAADGKYRALYTPAMFRWMKAAGATYRHALAWHLQERLGVEMERYGRDGAFTRVAGMPEDLVREWSKRRRTIEAMADDMGFATNSNAAAAAAINKMTRKAKTSGDGDDMRHLAWDLEAEAFVEDRESLIASVTGKDIQLDQETLREATARLERLPADLTEHEAVFRVPDVVERSMNATAGVMNPMAARTATERVLRHGEVVELDMPTHSIEADAGLTHTRVFSTREEIGMEEAVGRMAAEAAADRRSSLDAARIEAQINRLVSEGYTISGEQVAAIRYGAGPASGALAIIEGAAGAGKTTTLRPITDLYRENGYTVIATAVAWRTAVSLGNDCACSPYSVDKLLRLVARGALNLDAKTVIVVDEAGMLSTRQAHHILQFAREHGCKVIAAGDTRQHQPIGAGPGLRLMREAAGGVRVDQIRRQRPDLEDILVHVHGLSEEDARFRGGLMGDEERARVVAEYEAMAMKPSFVPWQIAASEALRDGDAAETIAAYAARDKLHLGQDLEETLTHLVDDWQAWRKANPGRSSTVIARTHDEIRVLSHLMRERTLAGTGDGERVVVQACRARADDTRAVPLEIARGDLLRIGTTVWAKRLFNGTIVEVDDFQVVNRGAENERVRISGRSEYGDSVSFFVDEIVDFYGRIRLDHGYAMTVASAQGRTVDAAFVLADDRAAQPTVYPAFTRHRDHLSIHVNQAPIAATLREWRPEDQADEAVSKEAIHEHLARAWSRVDPKVAAHDHMSERMIRARSTNAGGQGGPAWAAANDNGSGVLRDVGQAMRSTADRLRYGRRVAACGAEMRDIDATCQALEERLAQTGRVADVAKDYRDQLARHAAVADRMEPLVDNPRRFRPLWEDAGGVALEEAVDFRDRYRERVTWWRSEVAKDAAARKADRNREGAPMSMTEMGTDENEGAAFWADRPGAAEVEGYLARTGLVGRLIDIREGPGQWLPARERLALLEECLAAVDNWPEELGGRDLGYGEIETFVREQTAEFRRVSAAAARAAAWEPYSGLAGRVVKIRDDPNYWMATTGERARERLALLEECRAAVDNWPEELDDRDWVYGQFEAFVREQREMVRRGLLLAGGGRDDAPSGQRQTGSGLWARRPQAAEAAAVRLAGRVAGIREDPQRWRVARRRSLVAVMDECRPVVEGWPEELRRGWAYGQLEAFTREVPAALDAWKRAEVFVRDAEAVRAAAGAGRATVEEIARVRAMADAIEADEGAPWQPAAATMIAARAARAGVLPPGAVSDEAEDMMASYVKRVRTDIGGEGEKAQVRKVAVEPKTTQADGPQAHREREAPPRVGPWGPTVPDDAKTVRARTSSVPDSGRPGDRQQPSMRHGERDPLPTAREVRDQLAERAEDVCRHYLPAGTRSGNYWKIGNPEGDRGESTFVLLGGPARGHWEDRATGESGDLLDIIQRSMGLPGLGEALKEAGRFQGSEPSPARTRTASAREDLQERREDRRQRRSQALSIWNESDPLHGISGTNAMNPAMRYLRRRGLDPEPCASLRWHASCATYVDGELKRMPALLARIERPGGDFEAVARIFLDRAGRKAAMDSPKKHLGSMPRGGVWFGNRDAERIAMTEGIEDALAAMEAVGPEAMEDLAIVAAIGAGRVHHVELPATARELVLLQDPGHAGERAWSLLNERHASSRLRLERIIPDKDVNDDLLDNPEKLRELLRPLAAPQLGTDLEEKQTRGGRGFRM